MHKDRLKGIAIIGMAGRFPGAANVEQFWENLCNGVESISFFSDEEVLATGVDPQLLRHPDYVKAWGVVDGVENFDANFFGIPGREAEAMDPQHRLWLQTCVSALENAGYNSETYDGNIGVVSGVGISTYLLRHIIPNAMRVQALGEYLTFIGNDKDFMPTRASYKLNLRGPSHSVSTACSTSLVAAHVGVRQLLSYESDMVIIGGSNIKLPQKSGYLYRKGHLKSPDGHCHAFDAKARGTVFGNGVAAVVLKRAQEAYEDGDTIYGIIKGSALNNDGASKAGYTAPSVTGQSEVIAQAHALAGFDPETITHMETHGTGTELGDPVEIKALRKVFETGSGKKQWCPITSVKTNVGHLDCAGGVTGLIKLALSMKHGKIPPSLNFETPNPEIDFENSPFYVNTKLSDWKPAPGYPRRGCISAFGAGGTNAHQVLEEAPALPPSSKAMPLQLLKLTAKTPGALERNTANLLAHLQKHPDQNFADVVFTMNAGRGDYLHRRFVVCRNREEAIELLSQPENEAVFSGIQDPGGEEHSAKVNELATGLNKMDEAQLKPRLQEIGKLWMSGANLDWELYYDGQFRHRLPLPTYSFEEVRYWIEVRGRSIASEEITHTPVEEMAKKQDITDWFYSPSWSRVSLVSADENDDTGYRVVFVDGQGLGEAIAADYRRNGKSVITVAAGSTYANPEEDSYVIDPRDQVQYNSLFTELTNRGKVPSRIIHCWNVTAGHDVREDMEQGFYSLIYMAQALAVQADDAPVTLLAVSNHMHDVLDTDVIHPAKSASLGPALVIPQEHPGIRSRSVDVVVPEAEKMAELVGALINEAESDAEERVIAYRGGRRWTRSFETLPLGQDTPTRLRNGGCYLITGGMGGIGYTLAGYLAREFNARLIITGRSAFPERAGWDAHLAEAGANDSTSQKIQRVRELEELGADVLVVQADVANFEQMRDAVNAGREAFGEIHGVIHAAGLGDVGMIRRKTRESAESVLLPKVAGTRVLDRIFAESTLDFMVFCSSLAAFTGGYGQVSYVAANAFQDAFALANGTRYPMITINWDAWKEVGMAVARQTEDLIAKGISNHEGIEAFRRALGAGQKQVAISTHNLVGRVRESLRFSMDAEDATSTASDEPAYPRPEMSTPYAEARDELEKAMTRIWETLLGIKGIGVNDDFFELGADSIKGMNLVNILEKKLDAVFHIEALFDTSTVAELCTYLRDEYADNVAAMLGEAPAAAPAKTVDTVSEKVTPDKVSAFRALIPRLSPRKTADETPHNRQAVFVLAPPRSGSTLLRVMLAGHPGLFAPPELFLLSYNTIMERKQAFQGKDAFWLEGLVQAFMQSKDCSEAHTYALLDEMERRNASTKEVFASLQECLGGRLLVDKTPPYAYDRNILERAESDFYHPLYIHLQRHPMAMIHSYEEARLDVPLRHHFGGNLPYSTREIAEMIWQISHRNIVDFLSQIPAERQQVVRFEDLVTNPETVSKDLCQFLDLEFDSGMVDPYKETSTRMTEGINSESRMLGDMKFHGHKGIKSSVAEHWQQTYKTDFLGEETWELARAFGYNADGLNRDQAAATPAVPNISEADVDQMDAADVDAMLRQMMDKNQS